MIFFLFTTVFGYSQLSVNSTGKLVGAANTVVITTNDTTQLLAKRDTAKFANGIRASIYQDTVFAGTIVPNEEIIFETLIIKVANSGNKSLQFKPFFTMNRTATSVTTINATNSLIVNASDGVVLNTDWVYIDNTVDLTAVGDFQTAWFLDNTNGKMYEIMFFNLAVGGYLKVKKY